MDGAAKIITALAALIDAVAWPGALLIAVFVFRKEIQSAVGRISPLMDRMRSLKLGALEAELQQLADNSAVEDAKGAVTAEQIRVAAKVEVEAQTLGAGAVAHQLDRLCIEYDTVRRTMPPGRRRTSALTKILVQMRGLAPSASENIEAYMSSGSPGSRLTAVAMMQMEPKKARIPWLVRRFREDHPFIFYHAALALQNVANDAAPEDLPAVQAAAREALEIIHSFEGEPDKGSIEVLEAVAEDRFSRHYS